jgi:hypothetical protein
LETTAIYPNRLEDKEQVETQYNLKEFGDQETLFYTLIGTLFAKGYIRVVYGDHGPYIEFTKEQIIASLTQKFNKPLPKDAYYEWLTISDGSNIKVYDQKRDVKNIPFAPKGGHKEYRKEGYADYKPGFIYVSPYELMIENWSY